jgi:hypothetical protein
MTAMRGAAAPARPRRDARRRSIGAALVAVAAAVLVSASPGVAAATGTSTAQGTVTPLLDCLYKNSNGTYTAVLGYDNATSTTRTIAVGSWNQFAPSRFDGAQPTVFRPGVQHGAYAVTLTSSEYMGGPYWYLDGTFVFFGWSWVKAGAACSPRQLPASGNGTGIAVVLVVAGVSGALLLRRVARRSAGAPPSGGFPAGASQDRR